MSEFSLGAALGLGQPAPGYAQPADFVPGAFSIRFLSAYADAEVLRKLFRTSRAGAVLAIQAARRFGVRSESSEIAASPRRLARLQEVLAIRGLRPTSWVLAADPPPPHGPDRLALTLHHLIPYKAASTSLTVTCRVPHTSPAVTAALHSMYTFPALRSLILEIMPIVLPPPEALPHLVLLTLRVPSRLNDPAAEVLLFSSIGPYLPQLCCLVLNKQGTKALGNHVWPALFTAQSTTRKLWYFIAAAVLDSGLIKLLLKHAPDLLFLGVYRVQSLKGVGFGGRQWDVQYLALETKQDYKAVDFAKLPQPTSGRLIISCARPATVHFTAESIEGFDDLVRHRLPQWEFTTGQGERLQFSVTPADHLPVADDVAAMSSALTQLGRAHRGPAQVQLKGEWEWTVELAQAVAAALAAQPPHVTAIVSLEGPLTDAVLRALVHTGPRVQHVSASGLSLSEAGHAGTQWPWQTLTITGPVSVQDAIRLPALGGPASYVIRCHRLRLDGGAKKKICQRLQAIRWAPVQDSNSFVIELSEPKADAPHKSLKTQVSMLRAVQLSEEVPGLHGRTTVAIMGRDLTQKTVTALSGLPEWPSVLDLSPCILALPSKEYTQLARYIPTSYTEWRLSMYGFLEVYSMCKGLNQHRDGLGLPPVKLVWGGHIGEQERAVGEHVILTR